MSSFLFPKNIEDKATKIPLRREALRKFQTRRFSQTGLKRKKGRKVEWNAKRQLATRRKGGDGKDRRVTFNKSIHYLKERWTKTGQGLLTATDPNRREV